MNRPNLDKLATLILSEHEPLLSQWRSQVRQLPSAKNLDTPTLNDHIPSLLNELAAALYSHSDVTIPEVLREGTPPAHGFQRLKDGFDIEEVVAEYNILRDCIHDLAERNELTLQGQAFHIFNRVLDHAIGLAVQTFAKRQAEEVRQRREEYLTFVAHDLRTPLNAISLSAKILEVTVAAQPANNQTPKVLKALSRNVLHLENLVRKILDENTNLQTENLKLQRREFDLWPLVESLIHDLYPVAETAKTQLINNVPSDLVAFADASLLSRVFQNLIANAIKYTPEGCVIIDAKKSDATGGIECSVSDNGSGIPETLIPKVFDKGETGPENLGGMGLGLAIVKTFIEAHGGTVTVQSIEKIGSTFRFTLPGRSNGNA